MQVVKFENYSFKYLKTKEKTLKNINFEINQGEKVLIVGRSGSGKSTIIKCINGLNTGESSGKLEVNKSSVGTILQDSDGQFVGQTVGEDIAFILENGMVEVPEMRSRVEEISKLVDVQNLLDSKPNDLSGGQKQRVALAGVLIENSNILLFDEPLANLDPKTGEEAMKLIDQIHKKTNFTILIIEHRVEDVLHIDIDKIILMNDGEVVSVDTPKNMLDSGILLKNGIREPLDFTAKKYADVKSSDSEEVIKEKLVSWTKKHDYVETNEKKEVILEFNNVNFKYDVKPILKNVSFSIGKGEMLSIVGKNGAGKSTIAKLLCGFEDEYTGDIRFKGNDISTMSISERAKYIGYVMQNPNHMISQNTVKEEVEFSLKLSGVDESLIEEKVNRMLKLCGIYEYRNWPISMISYGQKKRTTIASILVLEPEILVLDEPTAAQDYMHYLEIMEFLKELNEELSITIIMITHDMHLMLEYTKRSIVLLDGEVIFDGSSIKSLISQDIVKRANLKLTSLYTLSRKYGLDDYSFVRNFINYERNLRK